MFGLGWLNKEAYSNEEKKIFDASSTIGVTILICGSAGIVMIAIWAYSVHPASSDNLSFPAFFGTDLLVAAASAAAGALFGFIFGIPRTLDPASRAVVATAAAQAEPTAASHALLAANTNLERISDWLTTLLIGATLVQIKDIAGWVGLLGANLRAPGPAANDAVVPIIVIYFFALSFLGVYLITRLYLTSAFQQTLGLLAGGAKLLTPDLNGLKGKLDAALSSGKTEDLEAAMAAYDTWTFSGSERDDPELNANIARMLAKLHASEPVVDLSVIKKLIDAVSKAATDTAMKAKLKADGLKTSDANLNAIIDHALK